MQSTVAAAKRTPEFDRAMQLKSEERVRNTDGFGHKGIGLNNIPSLSSHSLVFKKMDQEISQIFPCCSCE